MIGRADYVPYKSIISRMLRYENLKENVEALRGKCEEVAFSHEKFARDTIGNIKSLQKKYDSLEKSQKKMARSVLLVASVSTGFDLYSLS
jgi:hypothetical protein